MVPVVVIGPPVRPVPVATLVTVPVPTVVHVMGLAPPPPDVKTVPAAPAVVGRLKLKAPATDCGWMVTVPLVVPARLNAPVPAPAAPSVIVDVPLVVKPALV